MNTKISDAVPVAWKYRAPGKSFWRVTLDGSMPADWERMPLYAAPPAQGVDLSPIATRKLGELAAQGYVTNGVAIFNPATGHRGLVDNLGFVGWMGENRDAEAGVKS